MGMATSITSQVMLSFSEWTLTEAVERDATNIPHLENLIIDKQINGAKEAASVLQRIYAHFSGTGEKDMPVHVKIDGAPSIIAGIDPSDKKFFLGLSKSILGSDQPKFVKSINEIDTVYKSSDQKLRDILKAAFKALRQMQWKQPLQGDVLFTNTDKHAKNIHGKSYITFKPNLIMYAVPYDSEIGKKISNAQFGIAFHTTISGHTMSDFTPHIGADIGSLHAPSSVFVFSNDYKAVKGDTEFSSEEAGKLNKLLQDLQSATTRLEGNKVLEQFEQSSILRKEFSAFQNSLVNAGKSITPAPTAFMSAFVAFVQTNSQGLGKRGRMNRKKMISALQSAQNDLQAVLAWQALLTQIKLMMVGKLDSTASGEDALTPYYNIGNGTTHASHEGYVATDTNGNFVKLVDRQDYSKKNNEYGRFSDNKRK